MPVEVLRWWVLWNAIDCRDGKIVEQRSHDLRHVWYAKGWNAAKVDAFLKQEGVHGLGFTFPGFIEKRASHDRTLFAAVVMVGVCSVSDSAGSPYEK